MVREILEDAMRFELPAGTTVEIPDMPDAEAAVTAVCAHSAIEAEIAALTKGAGYCRFESGEKLDQTTADKIAAIFFEQGRDAAEDFITNKIVDAYDSGAENFLFEVMIPGSREMGRLLDAIADPIEEATDSDRRTIVGLVVEALKDRICEKLEEADDSKPFDIVPSHVRVEAFRAFGADGSVAIEDLALTDHVSNVFSLQSLMPNDNLRLLFEATNIGMDEFVAHVLAEHGVNLRGGPKDKALIAWLVKGDYIKQPDDPDALSNAAARAIAWKSFDPKKNPDLAAMLPLEKFCYLFSESSYGGIPCFVCRMPLRKLLDFDWTQPVLMTPQTGEPKSGGFIAIYHPWNGSGDVQSLDHPMPLLPGREGWKVSGQYGHAVDSVFGIVGHFYNAEPVIDERRLALAPSVSRSP
jgi:hypothetical protein